MPPYVRARQLSARYGISRVTAWRWSQDGKLHFPKPIRPTGGVSLYDVAELDAWFAARISKGKAAIPANDDSPRAPELRTPVIKQAS